jgi:hypothetical protein
VRTVGGGIGQPREQEPPRSRAFRKTHFRGYRT